MLVRSPCRPQVSARVIDIARPCERKGTAEKGVEHTGEVGGQRRTLRQSCAPELSPAGCAYLERFKFSSENEIDVNVTNFGKQMQFARTVPNSHKEVGSSDVPCRRKKRYRPGSIAPATAVKDIHSRYLSSKHEVRFLGLVALKRGFVQDKRAESNRMPGDQR